MLGSRQVTQMYVKMSLVFGNAIKVSHLLKHWTLSKHSSRALFQDLEYTVGPLLCNPSDKHLALLYTETSACIILILTQWLLTKATARGVDPFPSTGFPVSFCGASSPARVPMTSQPPGVTTFWRPCYRGMLQPRLKTTAAVAYRL